MKGDVAARLVPSKERDIHACSFAECSKGVPERDCWKRANATPLFMGEISHKPFSSECSHLKLASQQVAVDGLTRRDGPLLYVGEAFCSSWTRWRVSGYEFDNNVTLEESLARQ